MLNKFTRSLVVMKLALIPTVLNAEVQTGGLEKQKMIPSVIDGEYIKTFDSLPDFSLAANTAAKKTQFFHFLYPIIVNENKRILRNRETLLKLQAKFQNDQEISELERSWLFKIAEAYRLDLEKSVDEQINIASEADSKFVLLSQQIDSEFFNTLLRRVNIIPPAIALAQAALESGWGSSRFARTGNNIFGQWCYRQGCGMIPQSRLNDANHEVAQFASVNDAVRSYMRNLNSFSSYKKFRLEREKYSTEELNRQIYLLIPTLDKYSQQGVIYINKVYNLIRQNNLTAFKQFN